MRVVLVRHGETAWSRAGKHTGRTDIPLLDDGRHQAELVGARLRVFSFAAVWSSPLSRARGTSALAGLADRALLDDDLLEWDYGGYEGRRSADIIAERPGWNLFFDGCPDGEVFADVVRRVDRVIARIGSVGGDVALFAHGHLLRTLAARWLQIGPELAAALLLSPASVSILGRERNAPVIALWNDARHLEAP